MRWTEKSFRTDTEFKYPGQAACISVKLSLGGVLNEYLCWMVVADLRRLVLYEAQSPLDSQWVQRLEGRPNTAARLAGWKRVIRQVCCCTWWTGRTTCLFCTAQVALTKAAQLRADCMSSCCYLLKVHNHPPWATPRKEGMAWYSSRPMPSLCPQHTWVGQPHAPPPYFYQSLGNINREKKGCGSRDGDR